MLNAGDLSHSPNGMYLLMEFKKRGVLKRKKGKVVPTTTTSQKQIQDVYLIQTTLFVLCSVALLSPDTQCRICTSPNTKDEIWPQEKSVETDFGGTRVLPRTVILIQVVWFNVI